ncbi:hypothetical protein [Spongiactinospora sp. TRM90649]|uniref:hypothetical protein n=1 Tax=Spongiactinospora sp. TRM90649 TaxID=3031114 RepID=UPI0023F8E773|nr:hypothetical protein [Spongiactinospora sp. TRM90649]MDF5758580.1 hypothetical protein [Spongiactinospora sp. TRM90649]
MTPQELHALLDERRRELGLRWWQIAVQADVTQQRLRLLRHGTCSPRMRARAEEWLRHHRKQDPPPQG